MRLVSPVISQEKPVGVARLRQKAENLPRLRRRCHLAAKVGDYRQWQTLPTGELDRKIAGVAVGTLNENVLFCESRATLLVLETGGWAPAPSGGSAQDTADAAAS